MKLVKKTFAILLVLCALATGAFAKTKKSDIYVGETQSAVLEAEDSVRYTFETDENGLCFFTFENIVFTDEENTSRKPRLNIVIAKNGKTLSEVYYDSDEGEKLVVAEGLEAGEYHITVTNGERFVPVGFDVCFTFTQNDFVEALPGGILNAGKMENNETYIGGVATRENEDWYTFEMPYDGYALIGMQCLDAKTFAFIDGEGEVFDERSFTLKDATKFHIQRVGLSRGIYYIRVKNYKDYTDPVYSLWVRTYADKGFESENNNTKQTADKIELGKEYKGNLTSEGDKDVYTFELDAKSDVKIDFVDSIAEKNEHFRFTLLNNKGVIRNFDTYNSLKEKITLEKGTYFFKIYCPYPKYYHGESYRFKISADKLEAVPETDVMPEENTPETLEPEQEQECTVPAFSDVTPEDWFYDDVNTAFSQGLVKGRANAIFDPYGEVTVAEVITLASRLHAAQNNVGVEFDESIGEKWYTVYVAYAMSAGIVEHEAFDNYDRAATRKETAYIIDGALGNQHNQTAQVVIPDVQKEEEYADNIYRLYSLGIFKGADGDGRFFPENSIRRAEIAAVLIRAYNLR